MSNPISLPPKMALQYQEKAKRGEATEVLDPDGLMPTYVFRSKTEEVVLVALDPPAGYMRKIKQPAPNKN